MAVSVLPRIDPRSSVDPAVVVYLDALSSGGFKGDIRSDYGTRLSAATDNSIYQMLPAAVVFPRDNSDVAMALALLAEERFQGLSITARGGGTGTNGQSLTRGIVMDVSRHMRKIVSLDLAAGTVTVQPGVVLDDLNAYLKPHGVYFAANLSPSNRATMGGMISTDASGEGSRLHGKTSRHVVSVELVMRGGVIHRTKRVGGEELERLCDVGGVVGEAYRTVRQIARDKAGEIKSTFPKLLRYMTGYNLAHMATPDGTSVDLGQLVAGSEGSLGVLTEATLKLTHFEKERALFVLRYGSFDDALAGSAWLVATEPGSVETVDETVLTLARGDVIYDQVKDFLVDAPGVTTRAINLVEYTGDDHAAVQARVDALITEIARRAGEPGVPHGYALTWKPSERDSLWNLRKKGVGLLGNAPGNRKPVPFVEDTVVPPENLQAYVREFRAILDKEGLRYGMFGHVDVGCLHVRPALDLKDPEDEARIRRISDAVTELVTRHGGLLWGEHGKGFRSELVPHHFGPVLYKELQRIKAVFDPHNQFNPGKIATPAGKKFQLATIDGPTRGQQDRQVHQHDLHELHTVVHCNGNGQCFDTNADTLMCPSSKITKDRIHSPKGRASLMREWLRLVAGAGSSAVDALKAPGQLPWFLRLYYKVAYGARSADFSHEVYDAMQGCLACKACATQCPIKVDVPDFRAQFLELYHRRYARPLGDYMTVKLEGMLPVLGRIPRLANFFSHNPLSKALLRAVFGIVDAPALDSTPVAERLARAGVPLSTLDQLSRLPRDGKVVVVIQDAFTSFYDGSVLEASVRLLKALGYQPHVLPYFENGKALHIKGFLREFERVVRDNSELLRRVGALGHPLVGIEPAVVLTYRDEYPKLLGGEAGFRVHLLQEWLAAEPLAARDAKSAAPYKLMSHCTEQALVGKAPQLWADVFKRLGVPVELVKAGCCGMCGVYGHEARHLDESLGIFDLSWKKKLAGAEQASVLATGHSCRHQVDRVLGYTPKHPAEALLERLG